MQNQIPHFKYSTKREFKKQLGYIATGGEVLHWIDNLDEFYEALGYTVEMAKAGVMPDEFIWEEYIKDGAVNTTACLEMHIVEYLNKHSDNFRKKYGDQYESWITEHTDLLREKCETCNTCSINPFCSATTH